MLAVVAQVALAVGRSGTARDLDVAWRLLFGPSFSDRRGEASATSAERTCICWIIHLGQKSYNKARTE